MYQKPLDYIFIKKSLEGQKETTETGYLQRAAVSTNKSREGRGRSKISLYLILEFCLLKDVTVLSTQNLKQKLLFILKKICLS